ncbi:protein diaphanous homolog 3 isoform X2 [Rhinopithecus roxellana]|uniref:protein diaphanous homolog 3 isoform X2 n=1 Tax=Rhinopithecus roxellana TaxID=61622 RepID=UPI0012375EE6|nr:protein diaphanous homolog 3 isoform X2 [Rhinopithecus roxellana]
MERHRPRLHHPTQGSATGTPYPSSASLRGCRESKMPRRKGPQHPPPPGGPEEPGEKRPKFHLNIRTLTDDMLDKFASIRIPGSKKERPPLPNLKTTFASSDCAAAPLEMMENFPKPLSDSELLELFEKMMEDMNLNEDKKAPLREKDFSIKKEMVMQYINTASKTGSLKRSRQISPQEFIHELKMGSADERLVTCLESLRVSLTSNPVSWVENFGHEGLGLLLDILEKLISGKIQEKVVKKNQHKVIQCLKALMNTQYGLERIMSEERSLSLLTKAMDPRHPNMMTDVVKLLSAVCIVGEESILEEVLEALTSAGEEKKIDRFFCIVEGLRHNSVQLQVACMQLINALVTSPDDLDFRLHIRNEFMRCGLKEILPNLKCIKNDGLDIQLKVFDEHKEEDLIELSHRLEDIRAELDEAYDVYNMVWSTVKETRAEGYFISILQHLLLIRNDYFIRQQYFKLIDECVSQIVLHRDGMDPDFTYRKRLDLDLTQFLDICVDQAKLEEFEEKASELYKKFEKEFTDHQETQAELQKKEAEINELQAELQVFKSQFGALPADCNIPLPPSKEGGTGHSALPPPPPLPSSGGVPPPPPPPPPPPLPGMRMPFGGTVPPPPPLGFLGGQSSPLPTLPFGLKPKKEFKPEISMRRLNWLKIRPHEMTENCFWIKVNENKYENVDLLCKLENTFCCQQKERREEEDTEEKKSIKKKIKELKFLDSKIAQNLSIFLSSFRVPYEEIRMMILEVDETRLAESMIQNLIKHLPDQEQLNSLSQFKSEYNNLCEPEQFAVVMSNVKRLRPRLSAILFKLQFEEQVNNIKPDIMAVSTACEEIKKSKSFSKLLELVLLMGNYMNAGSRNAQTFGFNLSSLCKLKDTKSADQKTTLLHFLVEVCEEKYPDILNFVGDLEPLDKASKVSVEMLEKNLRQMGRQLQQLEKELETFPPPEDLHDKFVTKMSRFVISAKEQYETVSKLHENMEKLYQSIMGYYAIDVKKVSVEDFLTDLNNFRTTFMQAIKENIKKREAEEKEKRARIAKELAERERLERQQKKKRLLEVKTEGDETGVMDNLLEALQSGAAFRDRRKRTPMPKDVRQSLSPMSQRPVLKVCNHENQKVQLTEGSRSHYNINCNSTRTPVAKELNYNLDTHTSTGRIKAVEKKEACNVESNRKKETELLGSFSKNESVPEVEALLARLRAL